jgi:hypothetical protein
VREGDEEIADIPPPADLSGLAKPTLRTRRTDIEMTDLSEFVKVNDEIVIETIKVIASKDLPAMDEFYAALPREIEGFRPLPTVQRMRHPSERPIAKRPVFVYDVPDVEWD